MAGIEVAVNDATLFTLLGSCVGVILYDSHCRIGSLAHIVLPDSRGKSSELIGKFVDTAIPKMIQLIRDAGGNFNSLNARIAGGANMFNTESGETVGSQNLFATQTLLESLGIPILGRHCGGDQGRRVTFEVNSGRVFVEQVGIEGRIEI